MANFLKHVGGINNRCILIDLLSLEYLKTVYQIKLTVNDFYLKRTHIQVNER